VQTVNAMSTEIAAGANASATPGEPQETQPAPSQPPQPTNTQSAPQPTATSNTPCDRAGFDDETIPDGTVIAANTSFTKTWTLKNTGACAWDANYALVFTKGDAMGAPATKQLTSGTVAPGQTIQVSVDLKAPAKAGTSRAEFKLRNAAGVLFGIGDGGTGPFWVEIKVPGTTYNFVNNLCAAGVEWRSATGALPCPGKTTDINGYAIKVDAPRLETGGTEDEPAIVVQPQMVDNGWISGRFPAMQITAGSRFKAIIGCMADQAKCNVRFELNYIADGAAEATLAAWTEKYEGEFNRINLDLSNLAGKNVVFILYVRANGSPEQDQAFWLQPRIEP
jgi:hypothetical protein